MQPVSSRIWTRVAVSISYDDNHYTTGTFVGDLTPNPFYANSQFYFKQFCLAQVHSSVAKNIYFKSFSLFKQLQFS